jgi:tetracycline repressor-like protein
MIAACRALLVEQIAAGRLTPAIDLDTLAYVIIRVAESFLYSDVITGNQPDVGKAVEVVRVLLGVAPPRRPRASSKRPRTAPA